MNSDYEKRLAAEVHRQLEQLPELTAPATLAARVMARIEKRRTAAWYQQPWQCWPFPARVISLLVMFAVFSGGAYVCSALLQNAAETQAAHQVGGWLSRLDVVWNAAGALANAIILALKQLGRGFLIACIVVALFSYLACIGMGTLAVRLAFSNVRRNQL